jgi:hypothetical protein
MENVVVPDPAAPDADADEAASPSSGGTPAAPGEVPSAVTPALRPRRRSMHQVSALPDDLLAAARAGLSLRRLAERLGRRLGRKVSGEMVRLHLQKAGIRRPPPASRPPGAVTGDDDPMLTEAEQRQVVAYHAARRAQIGALLDRARAGDREALTALYTRYRLRLPLVEAQLADPLPWMHRPPEAPTPDRPAEACPSEEPAKTVQAA